MTTVSWCPSFIILNSSVDEGKVSWRSPRIVRPEWSYLLGFSYGTPNCKSNCDVLVFIVFSLLSLSLGVMSVLMGNNLVKKDRPEICVVLAVIYPTWGCARRLEQGIVVIDRLFSN